MPSATTLAESIVEVLLGLVVADVAGRALGTADRVSGCRPRRRAGGLRGQEGLEGALSRRVSRHSGKSRGRNRERRRRAGCGSGCRRECSRCRRGSGSWSGRFAAACGAGSGGRRGIAGRRGRRRRQRRQAASSACCDPDGNQAGRRPSGGRRPGGILKHSAYFMFRKEAALCQLWVGRIRSPTALENHTSDLQNPKMRIAVPLGSSLGLGLRAIISLSR